MLISLVGRVDFTRDKGRDSNEDNALIHRLCDVYVLSVRAESDVLVEFQQLLLVAHIHPECPHILVS